MDWSATKQSFLEEKGAVVLSGSARVFVNGVKVEADNIVYYRETRQIYAEGNCRLFFAETEISASSAFLDVDTESGYMVDAVAKINASEQDQVVQEQEAYKATWNRHSRGKSHLRANNDFSDIENHRCAPSCRPKKRVYRQTTLHEPYGTYVDTLDDPQARSQILLKADKLIRLSRLHLTAEHGFMTNDEMVHPIYGIKTGNVDFYLHESTPIRRYPAEGRCRSRRKCSIERSQHSDHGALT